MDTLIGSLTFTRSNPYTCQSSVKPCQTLELTSALSFISLERRIPRSRCACRRGYRICSNGGREDDKCENEGNKLHLSPGYTRQVGRGLLIYCAEFPVLSRVYSRPQQTEKFAIQMISRASPSLTTKEGVRPYDQVTVAQMDDTG